MVSIEILGQISGYGGETFTWTAIMVLTFLVPYALIFAETGSTFSDEGGNYIWVKKAFGRGVATVSTLFYWITTPVWIGGSMAFLAAETWSRYLSPIEHGSVAGFSFNLAFIWITVLSAIVSLKISKWLPSAGAIAKVALLALFLITTIVYAMQNGVHGIGLADLTPTLAGLLGVAPLLLFGFLGFEAANGAAGEMKNPKRDVPFALARSSVVAALCYLLPILAILVVLPASEITGIGGLMEAVGTVFAVYGAGGEFMLKLAAVLFVFVLVTQGAAWMIVSDRVQAIAAADGAFFSGFLGVFSAKLGTPIRINTLSGIVASVFMIASTLLVDGESGAIFGVVLTISISTYLISYLAVIPAAIKLRGMYRDQMRPYRVPVSDKVFKVIGSLCVAWVAMGSWVAVFPGTLEAVFGLEYDFLAIWGVTQLNYELFTIGTLVVLIVVAALAYRSARRLREESVPVIADVDDSAEPALR